MSEDFSFLNAAAQEVAPRLLGCLLVREVGGQKLVAKIVETEAYDQTDAASHSYRGRTPRTDVMFGPSGHVYVYFTYGMHYCMNVVCGAEGHGAAVLIRAVEPLEGADIMSQNRHGLTGPAMANGPAKVCYALKIDKSWNGHDLHKLPLQLMVQPPLTQNDITQTTRVGITKEVDKLWRFYVTDSLFVSNPVKLA